MSKSFEQEMREMIADADELITRHRSLRADADLIRIRLDLFRIKMVEIAKRFANVKPPNVVLDVKDGEIGHGAENI